MVKSADVECDFDHIGCEMESSKENLCRSNDSTPVKVVNRAVLETSNFDVNVISQDAELDQAVRKYGIDNSNKDGVSFKCEEETLVTASMVKEEEKLNDEGEKEEAKLKQQAIDKWKEMSEDLRLTQLNHLLEKSNIYANYLLDVIENSKKREKKRAARKNKKNPKVKNGQTNGVSTISDAKVDKAIQSQGKKRKPGSDDIDPPSKRHKKQQKKNKSQTMDRADPQHGVGDKIEVRKTNKDQEEDLLEAKVLDLRFIKDKWKYQVHYAGTKKSKDEWIEESVIVTDVVDDEDSDAEDRRINSQRKLETAVSQVDEDALLHSKFYTGIEGDGRITTVDGARYLNGQALPQSQPELLTGGILRDYQVTGYEWLKVLFSNAVNGILGDEMGLGKTIQCIAMICSLVKSGFQGPFLVCAPLSTICNWIIEFKKFAPQIPVLLYHGSQAERQVLSGTIANPISSVNCRPVVVTSYEILIRDRPLLYKHKWEYLVIDEGHRIKNINCRLLKELKMLKVNAKVLLTGTPLQNNLSELWSLLNFLLPEVFNDLSTFEAWFDLSKIQKGAKAISSEKEQNVAVMLQKILAPFLLRRTKLDIEIYLPPKRELLVFTPLASSQNKFYQAVANRTIRKLLRKKDDDKENELDLDLESGDSNQSDQGFFARETRSSTLCNRLAKERDEIDCVDDSVINVSLNNLMVQLRKCCNHPYLIQYPLIPGTDIYRVDQELVSSSGKMKLLDRMLPVLKKDGHKVLLFSQMTKMLDIIEDYCKYSNFSYFRLDGSTKCDTRQEYIDQFNNDPEKFLFLLSTRAGGLGINLTSADTVFIYDSDWNPQNDLQAQDRCHRIGQTRPVIIYRFVSANTVDQFMVERAEAKRVLERLIINRTKFKGKLAEDLKSDSSSTVVSTTLLQMLQSSTSSAKCEQPLSDEELDKILNRSTVMSCSNDDLTCGVFRCAE